MRCGSVWAIHHCWKTVSLLKISWLSNGIKIGLYRAGENFNSLSLSLSLCRHIIEKRFSTISHLHFARDDFPSISHAVKVSIASCIFLRVLAFEITLTDTEKRTKVIEVSVTLSNSRCFEVAIMHYHRASRKRKARPLAAVAINIALGSSHLDTALKIKRILSFPTVAVIRRATRKISSVPR